MQELPHSACQQSHEPDVLHVHQQNLWNPLSHEMDIIQPVALLKQEQYKLLFEKETDF